MVTQQFQRELEETLYIHKTLPLHKEKSLEAEFPQKKVLRSRVLWGEAGGAMPGHIGVGTVQCVQDDGTPVLRASAPTRTACWPEGAPEDGDYVNYGTSRIRFLFDREDWQGYNRLHFRVRPSVGGARLLYLDVNIVSEGEIPVPDVYRREGHHAVDLIPNEWNECYWEFAAMGRDAVTVLEFSIPVFGGDACMGQAMAFDFKDIVLELVEKPEIERGWQCQKGRITYSTVGYFPQGVKTAVANIGVESFELVDVQTGKAVYTGEVRKEKNARGVFHVLDFTAYTTPGSYYLRAGDTCTQPFQIDEGISEESVWRAVNFLFGERCGAPVCGRHGACHFDVIAEHNDVKLPYAGGWHDAGDVSQQTLQSAEVVHALLETAARYTESPALHTRLLEEAEWGLDFVLRTRFGDGWRATSAGLVRFSNGRIGDMDDVAARVYDHSYENFVFAGVEAYAATAFAQYDPGLAWGSLNAAKEDFGFAREKFAKTGVEHVQMYEHTYNCGLSQYYAAIVWAASCRYRASGEEFYAAEARFWAEKLLACQETGAAGLPFTGFFYRDKSHRAIVHFNHQSREQQFAQALTSLCETQPCAAQAPRWHEAMRRYGDYLLAIAPNTAPYGMLPAGVHRLDEPEDAELFPYLHLLSDYEAEKTNYAAQLAAGTPVGKEHVLRNFPVWFSFRGNTAILLSMGKSASLLGRALGDEALLQLGREQLYWMWGKNPFGQSLIYGSGTRYCSQYAAMCGELAGEMPVGVETLGNEDVPYWPQTNNATYKEVWTSSVSRWLWLAADYVR